MINAKGKLFVLSGPSGCGKNTVYEGILERYSDVTQTVSATTRAPREAEREGIDYYFISQQSFAEKVNNGEFIEYVNYGKNYYGTLKAEVERLLETGKIVLLIIDVNGADSIRRAFPEVKTIFLLPPSLEELKQRLILRGQNTAEEIECRLSIAKTEMEYKNSFDYQVVNDDLNECIEKIYSIMSNR